MEKYVYYQWKSQSAVFFKILTGKLSWVWWCLQTPVYFYTISLNLLPFVNIIFTCNSLQIQFWASSFSILFPYFSFLNSKSSSYLVRASFKSIASFDWNCSNTHSWNSSNYLFRLRESLNFLRWHNWRHHVFEAIKVSGIHSYLHFNLLANFEIPVKMQCCFIAYTISHPNSSNCLSSTRYTAKLYVS